MPPLLRVESASVTFPRGTRSIRALVDASLELEAGELGGVWGRRAAGKTTLAQVVGGVLTPDSGTVTLDGMPLDDAGRRRRRGADRAQIGLAMRAGPAIDGIAVEEWIASGLLTSHRFGDAVKVARLALERTGAAGLGPEPWEALSDGERTLVAIAQGIVRGPRVLVVDDPLAGAGPEDRDEIMRLLQAIAATGVAVLMTAAELIELRGLDRIWRLRDGRLEGPVAREGGVVVTLRTAGELKHGDG